MAEQDEEVAEKNPPKPKSVVIGNIAPPQIAITTQDPSSPAPVGQATVSTEALKIAFERYINLKHQNNPGSGFVLLGVVLFIGGPILGIFILLSWILGGYGGEDVAIFSCFGGLGIGLALMLAGFVLSVNYVKQVRMAFNEAMVRGNVRYQQRMPSLLPALVVMLGGILMIGVEGEFCGVILLICAFIIAVLTSVVEPNKAMTMAALEQVEANITQLERT
jgi:hypothetical protein